MSRRPDAKRLYQAQRTATLRRLESEGVLAARAEALVVAWEFESAEDGRERNGRWWEDAWHWMVGRRQ